MSLSLFRANNHYHDGSAPHDPVADQLPPRQWRPEWTVPHLVFQGGQDRIPRYSLTGGGFIPTYKGRSGFAGRESLLYQPYVTPLSSMVGGGQVPARTNFLTSLFKGIFEQGTS
jgi:hypothetical protein